MIKVNNSFAPYTPKMVVWLEICVEPFRIAGTFNNKSGFNFAQSSQRSINSIQGYTQKNLFCFSKNHLCRRMLTGLNESFVNSQALSCYFQGCITTPFLEIIFFFFNLVFSPLLQRFNISVSFAEFIRAFSFCLLQTGFNHPFIS